MSAIDDVLNVCRDPIFKPTEELEAEARADLQAAQERIAKQARQLDEARKVIERCSAYIGSIDHGENTKSYRMCDAWLAANPAPQVEQL